MIPGFDIIGIGSRVKVMIRCRKGTEEEPEKYFLQLRCEPIQELSDNKENFWVGQPGGEYIGDHLKSKKWFEKVKRFLEEKGYLTFQ
jgi:hypothetical protein